MCKIAKQCFLEHIFFQSLKSQTRFHLQHPCFLSQFLFLLWFQLFSFLITKSVSLALKFCPSSRLTSLTACWMFPYEYPQLSAHPKLLCHKFPLVTIFCFGPLLHHPQLYKRINRISFAPPPFSSPAPFIQLPHPSSLPVYYLLLSSSLFKVYWISSSSQSISPDQCNKVLRDFLLPAFLTQLPSCCKYFPKTTIHLCQFPALRHHWWLPTDVLSPSSMLSSSDICFPIHPSFLLLPSVCMLQTPIFQPCASVT